MIRRKRLGLVLALTWLMASQAWAGGFEVVEQSVAATGSASAATGRSASAAAAWFNPAAMADGGGLRMDLGVSVAAPSVHAQAARGAADGPWSADTVRTLATPPYLNASYARDDWAVGLSVNVPFGGSVQWPSDWAQRFDIISSKPIFLRVAPSLAWRLGALRLAGGVHFDTGRLQIQKATNHVAEEGSVDLSLHGSGVGLDLAAFVQATDRLSVGLSYKSRTALSLKGAADFEVPAAFATRFPDQSVSADWTLPDRVAVGAAYTIGDLELLTDLGLTFWSVNDELVFDFEQDVTEDQTVVNHWRNSVALRAGAQWEPQRSWQVRGGVFVDGLLGAPPPNNSLSPASPDSTRLGFSIGGSKVFGSLAIDLFYEYLRLLERQASGTDAPEAVYGGSAHLFGIGARFRG